MTTNSKHPLTAALALALALPLAAPASAGDDILVTSTSAMQAWQKEVTRDLDQRLLIGEARTTGRAQSGIVQLRFALDANGRPANIETHFNSSGTTGERVAKWAVRRLSDLDEAPVRNAAGVRYQANIIFADSEEERVQFAGDLRDMERTRLAAADPGERLVSLGN